MHYLFCCPLKEGGLGAWLKRKPRVGGSAVLKKRNRPLGGANRGKGKNDVFFASGGPKSRVCPKDPPKKTKVERELYICDTAIAIIDVHNNQRTQETGTCRVSGVV
jgi:hypothetical protein